MCSNNVPVSHCKDTYYFDKTNNYFKKVKEKGDQVSDLLCLKLTELFYKNPYYKSLLPPHNLGIFCKWSILDNVASSRS